MIDTTNVEGLSKEERLQYERDRKYYRDYMSTLDYAKHEGREEEIKEGEAKVKLSIAKSMKALGVSIDIIIKSTRLTEQEIEAL